VTKAIAALPWRRAWACHVAPYWKSGECFLTSQLAGRIIIELVDLHCILTGDWLIQCYVVIRTPGSLGFRPGWATVIVEQL
jgi:hypothetical protein